MSHNEFSTRRIGDFLGKSRLHQEAGECGDGVDLTEALKVVHEPTATPESKVGPYLLYIRGTKAGETVPLVVVRPDGSIEFGEHYDPDEAALQFWAHLEDHGTTLYEMLMESREREQVLMRNWTRAAEAYLLADARADEAERRVARGEFGRSLS